MSLILILKVPSGSEQRIDTPILVDSTLIFAKAIDQLP